MSKTHKKKHYSKKKHYAKKNKPKAGYLGPASTRALLASIETMAEHRI